MDTAQSSKKTKGGAKAASSLGAGEDVVLHLTRAVQTIAKNQESFKKAVDQFHDIEKDIEIRIIAAKKRMDEQEQTRNREMQELENSLERERKRKRIDLEQDIREFGTEQVSKMLGEQKKVAIPALELDQLRSEIQLKNESMAAAVKEAADKGKAETANKVESLQLRHQAEMAAVVANRDQQKQQIKVLEDTIAALRNELDQQRKLTREVAYAQAQAQANNARPPPSSNRNQEH